MNVIANLASCQLFYRDENQEKQDVIFFIHGNSSSSRVFEHQLNSSDFKNFRMIAVDLPGHGKSSYAADVGGMDSIYSLAYFANILNEFLNKLKIKNPIVVGHSMGGHIAIELSKSIEMKKLILFQTPFLETVSDMAKGFVDLKELTYLFGAPITDKEISELIKVFEYRKPLPSFLTDDIRKSDPIFRIKLAESVAMMKHIGEITQLEKLSCSILNIISNHDRLSVLSYYANLSIAKEIKTVFFDKSGHFPQIDEFNKFNKTLKEFCIS